MSATAGLLRRFRDSFSQGAAAIVRRRKSKHADDDSAAASAAAAVAAASAARTNPDPNVLLSTVTEVRLGQEAVWCQRLLQLRVDGRLYVAELTTLSPACIQLDGLRLAPNSTPGECGFRLATPTVPERTAVEARGLGKLEIGAWIKQLTLATGLASAYEPAAELLDLPSARAAALRQRLLAASGASGRRASMPAVAIAEQLMQLQQSQQQQPMHQQLLERQHSMLWRPLPPTPPEAAMAQRRSSLLVLHTQRARYL